MILDLFYIESINESIGVNFNNKSFVGYANVSGITLYPEVNQLSRVLAHIIKTKDNEHLILKIMSNYLQGNFFF